MKARLQPWKGEPEATGRYIVEFSGVDGKFIKPVWFFLKETRIWSLVPDGRPVRIDYNPLPGTRFEEWPPISQADDDAIICLMCAIIDRARQDYQENLSVNSRAYIRKDNVRTARWFLEGSESGRQWLRQQDAIKKAKEMKEKGNQNE